MLPVILAKTLVNAVGATVAAGGFIVGKAVTAVRKTVGAEQDASVADSEVFQVAFKTWLSMNGVFPSVTYVPIGDGFRAEDMKQTPIIVSNHMCYLDGLVLAAVFGAPKILAMQGTLSTPIIGLFAEEIGVIEVNREDKASRTATMEAITRHVADWRPGQRPLLLFPEGTTSNGDGLLPFKKGAFIPKAPVRPVVISYTGSWHPANTNFKTTRSGELEPTGDLEWCEQFLGHLVHSLQVKVLPPYVPNELECEDAQLYANNVQVIMSEAYERLRADLERRKEECQLNSLHAIVQRMTSRLLSQLESTGTKDASPQSSTHRAYAMPSSVERRRNRGSKKQ